MKTKTIILICVSLLCVVGHWAVAQSSWNPCGHATMHSPNSHSNVYATHNTSIITSNSHLQQIGSYRVEPMASTTYDQFNQQINNRRNTSGDPFGGGSLDQEGEDNPLEPGTPVGEVPWALMALLLGAVSTYKINKTY